MHYKRPVNCPTIARFRWEPFTRIKTPQNLLTIFLQFPVPMQRTISQPSSELEYEFNQIIYALHRYCRLNLSFSSKTHFVPCFHSFFSREGTVSRKYRTCFSIFISSVVRFIFISMDEGGIWIRTHLKCGPGSRFHLDPDKGDNKCYGKSR